MENKMTKNHGLAGIGVAVVLGACTVEPADPPSSALDPVGGSNTAGAQQATSASPISNMFAQTQTTAPTTNTNPGGMTAASPGAANGAQGAGAAASSGAVTARPMPGAAPASTVAAGDTAGMAATTPSDTTAADGTTETQQVGTVADDTAAAGATVELNTDQEPAIPMPEGGWFDSPTNYYGFKGSWYCFDDGVQPSSCVADTAPYVDGSMCLSGTTVVDTTFAAWGAGIGVSLADDDGKKLAYDGEAAGISGFEVTISGTLDGLTLDFQIPQTTTDSETPPEYAITAAGTKKVDITDLVVPSWGENAGESPNLDALYELKFQIKGGEAEGSYDFCIDSVVPY
jgi:hypothetical protein